MSDNNIETLLAQIAQSLNQIAMAMGPSPEIRKQIGEYPTFDWSTIGARVLVTDQDGPAIVEWNGKPYKRRAPDNKFGAAIWFSRCIGKAEDGANQYATLISFEQQNTDVDPIGSKARHILQAFKQRQPQQCPPAQVLDVSARTEEDDEPLTEEEAAALAAIEAEHRAIEKQLKVIYLATVDSNEKAWNAYYAEKDIADIQLANKKKLLEKWHDAAAKKGFKINIERIAA